MTVRPRGPAWLARRLAIWERDGRRCGICGEPVALEHLHVDHVTPVCAGGGHGDDNLRATHGRCNLGKTHLDRRQSIRRRTPTAALEQRGTKDLHVYIPLDLFERVQALAKAQRRTVNGQLVVLLEQGLAQHDERPA